MFRSIIKGNTTTLLSLGEKFASSGNHAAAILSLDYAFSVPLKLQAASLPDIARKLQTFFIYARMLQKLYAVATANPCDEPVIRKIFALQPSTEELFLLSTGSFMASQCSERLTPSARPHEQGTLVPRGELNRLIKHVLKVRLLKRVNDENNACRDLRPLQPCLPYAVFNQCNRVDCPRNHADYQHYTVADYNVHVRVHILQILIYQTLYAVENSEELARQQMYVNCPHHLYAWLIRPRTGFGCASSMKPYFRPTTSSVPPTFSPQTSFRSLDRAFKSSRFGSETSSINSDTALPNSSSPP